MRAREARGRVLDRILPLLEAQRALDPPVTLASVVLRAGDLEVGLRGAGRSFAVRLVPRLDPAAGPPRRGHATRHFVLFGVPSPPGGATGLAPTRFHALFTERFRAIEPPRNDTAFRRDLALAFGAAAPWVVTVPSTCDQRCVFCRDEPPASRARPKVTERALRACLREGAVNHRSVLFSGDDPLGWAGLPDLVAHAHALGYDDIRVMTPGARLGDGETAAALAHAGLDGAEVALYGTSDASHDRVTRTPGSFVRLVRGGARLRAAGCAVTAHTALVRPVLPALGGIAALCQRLGWSFDFAEALAANRGQEERFCAIAPTVADIRAAVAAAAPALTAPLALVGAPDCARPRDPAARSDIAVRGLRPETRAERAAFVHPGVCAACRRRDPCVGVPAPYVACHGDAGLWPFS